MKTNNISIILPVYNEEEVIKFFYNSLLNEIKKIDGYKFKILFVVDKSKDNTEVIIRDLINNSSEEYPTRAILMSTRFGHQECLIAGIKNSLDSDAIIMMDCDFQHPISLLKDLLHKYNEGYDIVNTSRNSNVHSNVIKKLGTIIFYKIIKYVTNIELNENSADFRLINKKVANIIIDDYKEKNIFLRGIVSSMGFRSVNISYNYDKRLFGKTKYNFSKMLTFALNGIFSFSNKPLYFILYSGLLLLFFSFISIIYYILAFFFNATLIKGWSSLIVAIFFFGSIQLIFIGILGVYIAKIFDEMKNRPSFLISEIIEKKSKHDKN